MAVGLFTYRNQVLWVAVTQNFEDKEDFESIQMFMIGCHLSS